MLGKCTKCGHEEKRAHERFGIAFFIDETSEESAERKRVHDEWLEKMKPFREKMERRLDQIVINTMKAPAQTWPPPPVTEKQMDAYFREQANDASWS